MRVVYQLLFLCFIFISFLSEAQPILLDNALAIVNNDILTQTDFNNLKSNIEHNARKKHQKLPPDSALYKQLINKLVDNQLMLQQANKLGVAVSDTQIEQAISNIIQGSSKIRQAFIDDLRRNHISYPEFRYEVHREMLINQARQSAVGSRIHIDKRAVESLVKMMNEQRAARIQYHVGHIMLKFRTGNRTIQQLKKKLRLIINELKAGKNFQQLAMTYSDSPKALQGGDWGWMTINQMPTIFAQVIHQQGTGTIIGPFRSGVGYHILKILGIRGTQRVRTAEVKARHILIKPSVIMSDDKAKFLLEKIRQDILSGKGSFSDYAQKYSQDLSSAIKGGKLGWSDPSSFVSALGHESKVLPIGKISQPFHSQLGWHILEIEKRRTVDTTTQSKRKLAFQILYQRQFREQSENWINQLRRQSYIKIISPKR